MGFDYEAYRNQQMGGNPDRALIVTFEWQAEKRGDDFENVAYTKIWLDKNSEVVRRTTEEDKKRFRDRWEAFERNEEAPPDGTPIKMVPFATPSNVSACKAEKILTVEQLVETPDSKLQRAHLLNFKYQCADMLKQLKDSAHVRELRDEIEKLKKLLAAKEEAPETKKARGRPRKVNGDDQDTSE